MPTAMGARATVGAIQGMWLYLCKAVEEKADRRSDGAEKSRHSGATQAGFGHCAVEGIKSAPVMGVQGRRSVPIFCTMYGTCRTHGGNGLGDPAPHSNRSTVKAYDCLGNYPTCGCAQCNRVRLRHVIRSKWWILRSWPWRRPSTQRHPGQ
jgi:hypothetical protein